MYPLPYSVECLVKQILYDMQANLIDGDLWDYIPYKVYDRKRLLRIYEDYSTTDSRPLFIIMVNISEISSLYLST